jgi:hypothetical protein
MDAATDNSYHANESYKHHFEFTFNVLSCKSMRDLANGAEQEQDPRQCTALLV